MPTRPGSLERPRSSSTAARSRVPSRSRCSSRSSTRSSPCDEGKALRFVDARFSVLKRKTLQHRDEERNDCEQKADAGDEQVISPLGRQGVEEDRGEIPTQKATGMSKVVDAWHQEPIEEHDACPALGLAVNEAASGASPVVHQSAEQPEDRR